MASNLSTPNMPRLDRVNVPASNLIIIYSLNSRHKIIKHLLKVEPEVKSLSSTNQNYILEAEAALPGLSLPILSIFETVDTNPTIPKQFH